MLISIFIPFSCILGNSEAIKEFDHGEVIEDATLKCYMHCIFDKVGLLSSKGDLFLMRLLDHIKSEDNQNTAYEMGRKCLYPPEGADKCEKSFYFHECWKKSDPKHYFLI